MRSHPRHLAAILTLTVAAFVHAGPHGPSGWARGDLHQHTEHSDDANWKPEPLWQRIRETLPVGARFTVTADHNDIAGFFPNPARPPTKDNFRIWGHVAEVRRSLGNRELMLTGQELGGLRGGHIGAVFLPQTSGQAPPTLITKKGFRHGEWMQRIHAAGGLNVIYHPRGVDELGPVHPGTFTKWAECMPYIDLISAWNGYKLYDEPDRVAWDWIFNYWLEGRRFVAVGGSDSHKLANAEGQEVPYWGLETGKIGFEAHPMNPHNRVRFEEDSTSGALTEDALREGFRAGRVTVADWHQNWADASLTAADGESRGGIGDQVYGGTDWTYRVEGYGAPEVYSADPVVLIEYGQVRAQRDRAEEVDIGEGEQLTVDVRVRQVIEVPIPRGDFAVEQVLELTPGDWVVAARIVPKDEPDVRWKGVQLLNPVYVKVK